MLGGAPVATMKAFDLCKKRIQKSSQCGARLVVDVHRALRAGSQAARRGSFSLQSSSSQAHDQGLLFSPAVVLFASLI